MKLRKIIVLDLEFFLTKNFFSQKFFLPRHRLVRIKLWNSMYLVKVQLIEIEGVTEFRKTKILHVIFHKENFFPAKKIFDHYRIQ